MELRGSRIKLSPFDSSDRQLFIEISMCPIMMEHVYEPLTYQEAVAAFELKSQSWQFESDHWLSFGIEDISSGEKLGSIGLKVINHKARIAEVGYMIKQSAQGRGIAGEALTLIKQFGYRKYKPPFCSSSEVSY
ncbi:GNAT family N-acetyltransferase, partial [Vibrio parahaemolyticus]|nr:GNAT family N-acetyltransferase [Vibrio parahaemolyticus]